MANTSKAGIDLHSARIIRDDPGQIHSYSTLAGHHD